MLTEFDYQIVSKAKLRRSGIKAKATVTDIRLMKAGEIYKKGAKNPEQVLYAIYAKIDGGGWEGRIGTITKPPSKQISPKTKLAQFRQRYKQFPKVGMKVDVLTEASGYWQLVT